VLPFYADDAAPDEALARYPILARLPAAVASRGHRVRVLCHAPYNARLVRDGVVYEFIAGDRLTYAVSRRLYQAKPRYGPAYFELAWRMALRLRRLRPEVVHIFGLTMDLQLALLGPVARSVDAPVVVHFHGGAPEARARYLRLQRWNGRWLSRALFTTPEQAEQWVAAGVLRPAQTALVVESSSPFQGLPRAAARTMTAMTGDPALLCAGSLTELKDPLTVLRAFRRIAVQLPDARLYLYYLYDDLLPDVQAFLADYPELAGRVELRGRAPLAEMEAIYSSAELLLQASRREWSGLAILEAMSCGCIPIISDIPSFRMMTAGGQFGRLFPVGDDAALAAAVLEVAASDRAALSTAVRDHFAQTLSFDAVAEQLDGLYRSLTSGS
jgi:glycosyltransferase involved in cell wall biosynthesis